MYETETNIKTETSGQIPEAVSKALAGLNGTVLGRTVLPWSEHCTECVWPTCYTTCDLYVPREDGRCRRFADGMVRIECPSAFNKYLLKIRFKRWGKLWAPANVRLRPVAEAMRVEQRDYIIGKLLYQLPVPTGIKRIATGKRYSFKKKMVSREASTSELPTSFLLECYNPALETVRVSLTMRSTDDRVKIPFQRLIELTPGFHRIRVPMDEITRFLTIHMPFNIELIPNEDQKETTLYFGMMDFVREAVAPSEMVKKIKCVVWDLDNTLWQGVLVEQPLETLRLRSDIAEIIRVLDERGILNSVASKNNHDEAMHALRKFRVDQYFLCPQISWLPKSVGIKAIAAQLNIGLDTILFVDDSEFELAEIRSACPKVRTLNARDYMTLPQMNECLVPVTEESKARRSMYQVEANRQSVADSYSGDYMSFLRDCEIKLSIVPMTEENLERVHELAQRTNQMNFSGNRYNRGVLRDILSHSHLDTFVLSCEDRFGSYGIIGFSVVDKREPRMTDLMFSCRVQSKRVEHAFLTYILRKYLTETGKDFWADYRKTERNAPSGRVFADLGMEEASTRDGVTSLVFRKERAAADDGVIEINVLHEFLSPSRS
jgi:FkbH-like protein